MNKESIICYADNACFLPKLLNRAWVWMFGLRNLRQTSRNSLKHVRDSCVMIHGDHGRNTEYARMLWVKYIHFLTDSDMHDYSPLKEIIEIIPWT